MDVDIEDEEEARTTAQEDDHDRKDSVDSSLQDEMAEIQNHLHGDQSLDCDEKRREDENLKSLMIEDDENDVKNMEMVADNNNNNNNNENDLAEDETDEEDEEEDNVHIFIGDFKSPITSTSGYLNLNLQKGGRQFAQNAANTKTATKSTLDLDAVGTYNGMQIFDVNLDSIEDKPWRKPGSDITDYFNYGFTEETWKVYCERQRKIRSINQNGQFDVNAVLNMTSSSALMVPNCFMGNSNKNLNSDQQASKEPLIKSLPNDGQSISTQAINENSKYNNSSSIVTINTQPSQVMMNKKAVLVVPPPPTSTRNHSIDVIGSQAPPNLPLVPPPPLPPGHSLLGPRPSLGQPTSTSNSDRGEAASSISVLGNRAGPSIPFPPTLQMPPPPPPPFAFGPPPHDSHFPPSIRTPLGILPPPPPIGPGGQPLPFSAADFQTGIRAYAAPPTAGILPHPPDQRSFEDFDERRRRPMTSNEFEEFDRNNRDRYRNNERDFEERLSSSRHTSAFRERDYERDRDRDRDRERERDRKERSSRERSRDRASSSQHESSSNRIRNNRDRESRKEKDNKEREREHRDRDRDHREKESSNKSSSSKHGGESSGSASDHKHRSSHAHSSSSSSKSSKSSSKRETSSSSRSKDSSRKENDSLSDK